MSDPDPRQHGQPSEASDDYRPFHDPKHPSWYSDASAPAATPPVPPRSPSQDAAARNPYAEQPLAGPYGDGQPQYPIHGQYPVIANQQQRQAGSPYPTARPGPGTGAGLGAPVNGMAIAAMVLGIVGVVTGGFLLVPQVLAIILGHLSLNKDRQSRGFAIAGLVMGYLISGFWVLGILGFIGLIFTY
ncbi:DUF4190 domain-containing protein [Citricoccus nitrophenolicus]|uniref:DUF4190 domain-containing protein n=1 Tax=Citricoccus nitrophenolicus TaxID=863575 RepID=A0ABV0IFN1_9MICC